VLKPGAAIAIVVALAVAARAEAAPAADVVVVWAPGASPAQIGELAAVARDAGAALIDRSQEVAPPIDVGHMVAAAIAAYDALRLEDARGELDRARTHVDTTGADGVAAAQLSDLFLYRGLVRAQQGDDAAAWDELVIAATLDPARVLDPARFPPRVIAEWDRARSTIAALPRATLTVDAPAGCAIYVDAAASEAASSVVAGTHWLRVTCPDHAAWSARVAVTAPDTAVVARPVALVAPSDADLAIQARVAGARALVVAEVHALTATARLVDADGRERDRRTVALPAGGDLAPLAAAVAGLLSPAAPRPTVAVRATPQPWYRSRWAYAAGAALLTALVVVPVTAELIGNGAPTTATIQLTVPKSW
jgi:hypothetical protein